jgi:hypothetical protein
VQPPFGLLNGLVMFILSPPAVLWGGRMFSVGRIGPSRTGPYELSVLIALSVDAVYLFSVAATFLFKGDGFYEAAVVLLAFILFGHWMEMPSHLVVKVNASPKCPSAFRQPGPIAFTGCPACMPAIMPDVTGCPPICTPWSSMTTSCPFASIMPVPTWNA